jgi:DNA polymerase-3 subunit alpha
MLIPVFELPEEDKKIYEEAMKLETSSSNSFSKLEKENSPLQTGEGQGGRLKTLTSDEWYLRYLSFSGLNKRFDANLDKEIIFKLIQKLDKPNLQKSLTETSPEELKELSLVYYTEEKKEILSSLSQLLQERIEKLEYELVVVHEMGFDAYFLIVADYINWAKNNDVPVGP